MKEVGGANDRAEGDLLAIRSRLMRIRFVKGMFQSKEEIFWQALECRPTSAARSEHFAEKDEIWRLIHNRVGEIHRFLLETGKKGEDLPDYEKIISDGSQTPEELEKRYWRKDGKFDAFADRDPGPLARGKRAERKEKLFLVVVEPERALIIYFDFKNIFSLMIEFPDPNEEEKAFWYDSSKIPLSRMTDEEFRIIKHYLDEYFSKVIVPSRVRA